MALQADTAFRWPHYINSTEGEYPITILDFTSLGLLKQYLKSEKNENGMNEIMSPKVLIKSTA